MIFPGMKNTNIVHIGNYVEIGERVKIEGFKGEELHLSIGNNVKIGDDARIIASGHVTLADNVTLHNHVSILGGGGCTIGKGTWVAQYTMLDATGELEIGWDCCIGYNCQIWSHLRRVPQLPDYQMKFKNKYDKTILRDRVWLMGGMISVSPGVIIEEDCIILTNSVVTKSTLPGLVYGGVPARLIYKYNKEDEDYV